MVSLGKVYRELNASFATMRVLVTGRLHGTTRTRTVGTRGVTADDASTKRRRTGWP